jgi:hypothetical protein
MMHAFIALSPEERAIYCRQAPERLPQPLPAAVIEKDFWVSWLLQVLVELPATQGRLTFKGGTSLSKAYGLIDRFSEDIDLVLDRALLLHGESTDPVALSNTQRKAYLDRLAARCTAWTTGTLLPALQARIAELLPTDTWTLRPQVKGKETNLLFDYPGSLKGELGALLPHVLVELVPRADDEPNAPRPITPLVYEALPDALGSATFHVPTLAPQRTLLEKALLLHETVAGFNKGSERKSRHYYDLLKLDAGGYGAQAMADRALFEAVVQHRRTFYRYNQLDYDVILGQGITIVPPQDQWPDWRGDYDRSRAMIHTDVPNFEQLMDTAKRFQDSFNAWVRSTAGTS